MKCYKLEKEKKLKKLKSEKEYEHRAKFIRGLFNCLTADDLCKITNLYNIPQKDDKNKLIRVLNSDAVYSMQSNFIPVYAYNIQCIYYYDLSMGGQND